jgi:FixJ family two-component response regulator
MVEPHRESYLEESPVASAERSAEKPCLLVVTADDALRRNLVSTLSAIYCVSGKPTAEHALSSLGHEPTDLVIASFNLPGTSGLELVRRVQASYPDIGVVLMSLQPSISEAAQAFRVGALAYLPAPFRLRDILNAIEEALQEMKGRRQSRRAETEAQQRAQRLEEEAREMAERLTKAERLAVIGEITEAVRHEINDPLTSLLLQVELLRESRQKLPAEVQQGLDYIYRQCQQIVEIMSRLTVVQDQPVHYTRGFTTTDLRGSEEDDI